MHFLLCTSFCSRCRHEAAPDGIELSTSRLKTGHLHQCPPSQLRSVIKSWLKHRQLWSHDMGSSSTRTVATVLRFVWDAIRFSAWWFRTSSKFLIGKKSKVNQSTCKIIKFAKLNSLLSTGKRHRNLLKLFNSITMSSIQIYMRIFRKIKLASRYPRFWNSCTSTSARVCWTWSSLQAARCCPECSGLFVAPRRGVPHLRTRSSKMMGCTSSWASSSVRRILKRGGGAETSEN